MTDAARVPVRCLKCRTIVAYVHGTIVRKAARALFQTGELEAIAEKASVAAGARCPTCEAAAESTHTHGA